MSDGRLRRFLNLERPRTPGEDPPEDAPAPATGRFDGVERPAAGPAAEPRTGAQLDRFGPDPEPGIELLEADAGARPFTRCMRCGMDDTRFATACAGCGARLDTPEQQTFNEDLWARRQAEAACDADAERERQARRAESDAEEARARRALGETLAREVGRSERARLDAADGGWGGSGGWGGGSAPDGGGLESPSLGIRLLRLVPDGPWRLAAAIGAGALALGLLLAGLAGARPALALGILLVVVLVAPPGSFRRRRW